MPDYQGRASWYLISAYGAQASPKAGEDWRFLVNATLGSQDTQDKRWVQILIPPGQEGHLFAARPELRIPGAAPMPCVDDPTPATTVRWVEDGDTGYNGGSEVPSPYMLLRDKLGRNPAQEAAATAAAEARAKAAASAAS